MIPIIVLVGRPNTGKSTLFNRLVGGREALVADRPGVTRDRRYGRASRDGRDFMLVDTGGLVDEARGAAEDETLAGLIAGQTMQAVAEADAVIWLLDGRAGVTAADETLAGRLRGIDAPVYPAVNKTEGLQPALAVAEFHALGGFHEPRAISAQRGGGVAALMDAALGGLPAGAAGEEETGGVRIAIMGRPNTGKSTLVNRMLGEERVLAADMPGTTRDSIAIPFTRRDSRNGNNGDYVLIDTAGIRRRGKTRDPIEKFSVVKSLRALTRAQVVILLLDAQDAITEQDQRLLGMIADAGKSLLIAINKWDDLAPEQKDKIERQFARKMAFVEYPRARRISALRGSGVDELFDSVDAIMAAKRRVFKSAEVTAMLYECLQANPPPMRRGRRVKLRYAHIGGDDPLRVVIHGNQTEHVPAHYRRYLAKQLRRKLGLIATPVLIEFRRGDNPYAGRKHPPPKKRRRRATRQAKK